jgi:hypothetical protein
VNFVRHRAEGSLYYNIIRKLNRVFSFFQAKPRIQQNSGLIQQSPAKIKQGKSLDFLRRIGPFQALTLTLRAFFSFLRRLPP